MTVQLTANSKFLILNLQENANNKQTNNEANIPAILSNKLLPKQNVFLRDNANRKAGSLTYMYVGLKAFSEC